ncbi:hypothetical protein J4N45_11255 [Vibrio sp. SCSIO 43140]|uniref:hypothetical protein n=1 Tax=Vibrio sp. SCSIO 43140 TaxID=2819100 RepID=UPI0020757C03|nr:hypothetical protein [Vibrio sp. SCSIO 43140]USD59109.1 hypothetical protein J4N45_11255 [Vibrio sp. SCSIO 43140]
MTKSYQLKHDPSAIADVCAIGLNTLKRWQEKAPAKAELFDTAYELWSTQPHTYDEIMACASELSIETHSKFHNELGLASNVEQCPFKIIPLTTIRRWMNDRQRTYLMTLIGYQALSIKKAMSLDDAKLFCQITNISFSELTRICVADPIAIKKIAQSALTG